MFSLSASFRVHLARFFRPTGQSSEVMEKKHYEDIQFNVISVTRGWVGVEFPEKKRYVTLEWPICL